VDHHNLITLWTAGLSAALVLGFLAHRLRLSPIVGYLLAGIVVGPLGVRADRLLAEQLAELGVMFLMFDVGLRFHIKELWAVKRIAIPGAVVQITVATLLGTAIGLVLGWTLGGSVIFGSALSVASTVVLIRVLTDNDDLHKPAGHVAVGWLVVEDLATILALVLLPALFGSRASETGIAAVLGWTALKVGMCVAVIAFVGSQVLPRLLRAVAATRMSELFALAIQVMCLGVAVASAHAFDVSMPLGAFLTGLVIGRTPFGPQASSDTLPMKNVFSILFFVSVGMLLDPAALLDRPGLLAATLAVVLIAKPLAAAVIVRIMGYPFHVLAPVSVALAQIGEFSFILVTMGRELGLLDADVANVVVAVAGISIMLNPLLYRGKEAAERWAMLRPRLWRLVNPTDPAAGEERVRQDEARFRKRIVIVGYGPVGETAVDMAQEIEDVEPVVIDMNPDTVRSLQEEETGVVAQYGDATQRYILQNAGIGDGEHTGPKASVLIISVLAMKNEGRMEIIRLARQLDPALPVVVCVAHHREAQEIEGLAIEGVTVLCGERKIEAAIADHLQASFDFTEEERAAVLGGD